MRVFVAAGSDTRYADALAGCLKAHGHTVLLSADPDSFAQINGFQPDVLVSCGAGALEEPGLPLVQVVSSREETLIRNAEYYVFTGDSTVHGDVGNKFGVIHQPVRTGRFRAVSTGDGNTVLAISRLCPEAGHRTLIRAMIAVNSGVQAAIVGSRDGSTAEHLHQFAVELGVGDRVTVTEETQDVGFLLQRACAGVDTNLGRQSVSYAVQNFMCFGVPVLASAVPGIRDIVTDGVTGLLHSPGNWRQLAGQINYLVQNTGAAEVLSGNALRYCEKELSYESAGGKWTAVLEQLSFR
jgi:glycosyltransferase involved in cell wall biosynthesis